MFVAHALLAVVVGVLVPVFPELSRFINIRILHPTVVMASSTSSHLAESSSSSTSSELKSHAGTNPKGLLVLIPDGIDVEEEARFYDDIVDVRAESP